MNTMLRRTGAGWTFGVAALVLVAMTPLIVQAWAPARPMAGSPQPLSAQDPPTADAEPITAYHHRRARVVVGQPDRDLGPGCRASARFVNPVRSERSFYTTNGLSGKKDGWKDYHDRIMNLYRELFEPVGVTFASVSPKGSARWDAIRTADDLRPDPKRVRSGQVVTPQGERARDAQVIVLPTAGPFAMSTIMLSGTQLRDPFDERWLPTDENGHFVVYPTDDSYLLAILHPSGFAIQAGPTKNVVFRLQPWATIKFSSTGDVADQQANVSITPTGAKPGEAGFAIYSIETKGKPVEVKVPAGAIVLSRSLTVAHGTSTSLPVKEFSLKPGETAHF